VPNPLLGLVAARPQRPVDHLEACAELAVDDLAEVADAWRPLVPGALAIACAGVALVLAGVLLSVAPLTASYRLSALVVAPVVPVVLALLCWIVLLADRAAAATVGAGVGALKPWRGMPRPEALAGLPSSLAVAATGRIPLPSWIARADTLMASLEVRPGKPPVTECDKAGATSSD
jgi:hypothetical protein